MADYGICAAPGCSKPARQNRLKLCSMHDARMRRGGSLEPRQPRLTLSQLLDGEMQFGWWAVLGEGEPYQRRTEQGRRNYGQQRTARCRCACGVVRDIPVHTLKQGHSRQCGCKQHVFNEQHVTHGESRRDSTTVEYRTWRKMIERCEQPNSPDYANYGGRGIGVCERWRLDYTNFLSDMGRRPARHSIDRIDVNGNYEPSNCRWANNRTQAQNKRTTLYVRYQGKRVCLMEACRRAGIEDRYQTMHQRIKRDKLTFAQAVERELERREKGNG